MRTSPQLPYRTRMFARVLGPYLFIAAASLVARPSYVDTLLRVFDGHTAWLWVTGAFVLPMGLVIVALHPYYRGLAQVTVSVLGWLTVLKGAGLMMLPQRYLAVGQDVTNFGGWWQTSIVLMMLVGLYLSVVGWLPK